MSWWEGVSGIIDSVGGAWAGIEDAKTSDPEYGKEKIPPKGENNDGSTIVAAPPSWQQMNPQWLWIGGGLLALILILLSGGRR